MLLQELKDLEKSVRSGCRVATILDEVGDDEGKETADTLSSLIDTIPASKLSDLLRDHDYDVSRTTIMEHRHKRCLCFRTEGLR